MPFLNCNRNAFDFFDKPMRRFCNGAPERIESPISIIDDDKIYDIADKYAKEAKERGDKDSANKVRLDNKMVAAGQTCTF